MKDYHAARLRADIDRIKTRRRLTIVACVLAIGILSGLWDWFFGHNEGDNNPAGRTGSIQAIGDG